VTATINSNASGVWARREGLEVVVVGRKANGMSTQCHWPDDSRHTFFIPTRWLDVNVAGTEEQQ
jgi:hypothetical protein